MYNDLNFEEDVRHTDPDESELRRDRSKRGWQDAIQGQEYGEGTLQRLTWQNLGYRLGKLFKETPLEMVDEMYDWSVRQQSR